MFPARIRDQLAAGQAARRAVRVIRGKPDFTQEFRHAFVAERPFADPMDVEPQSNGLAYGAARIEGRERILLNQLDRAFERKRPSPSAHG